MENIIKFSGGGTKSYNFNYDLSKVVNMKLSSQYGLVNAKDYGLTADVTTSGNVGFNVEGTIGPVSLGVAVDTNIIVRSE